MKYPFLCFRLKIYTDDLTLKYRLMVSVYNWVALKCDILVIVKLEANYGIILMWQTNYDICHQFTSQTWIRINSIKHDKLRLEINYNIIQCYTLTIL